VQLSPSIDMHMLTNWIPDIVLFSDVSNKLSLWNRLVQNFRDQNIIICLQAHQYSEEAEAEFYAVLDLFESDDLKILQCKCPLLSSPILKGFAKAAKSLPLNFQREQALAPETGVFYVVWGEDIGL
jgi:hypothetical protein